MQTSVLPISHLIVIVFAMCYDVHIKDYCVSRATVVPQETIKPWNALSTPVLVYQHGHDDRSAYDTITTPNNTEKH